MIRPISKTARLVSYVLFFVFITSCVFSKSLPELQKDFVNHRFGMFIHFSVATYLDVEHAAPNLPDLTIFNPIHLDCGQWADATLSAKMTYGVLTVKHHEGFCLWPSKYTGYNVSKSAYKGDVVAEYAKAFRERGLGVGFYYSIRDRTQKIGEGEVEPKDIEFIKNQLTELLTNYGDIFCIVFDAWGNNWHESPLFSEISYDEIYNHIKSIQPNCLVINHQQQRDITDILHYEQNAGWIINSDNVWPAQSGPCIQSRWFWDTKMPQEEPKSLDFIINKCLIPFNKINCNLLLNCAPNREGLMDQNVLDRLKEVGMAWSPPAPLKEIPKVWKKWPKPRGKNDNIISNIGDLRTLQADLKLPCKPISSSMLGLAPKQAFVVDFHDQSMWDKNSEAAIRDVYDQKILKLAIQGMINRHGEFIYMDHGKFLGNPPAPYDRFWINRLHDKYGFDFIELGSSDEAFISKFASMFNGIILFDPKPSDNYILALNLSNVNFCLPVSTSVYSKYRKCFGDLPVLVEIKKHDISRSQIYEWLIKEVMPQADKTAGYALGTRFPDNLVSYKDYWPNYINGGVDYAFYRKMFFFNVTPLSAPITAGIDGKDVVVQGNVQDQQVFEKIMKSFKPPAVIMGWSEPEATYSSWGHIMGHNIWMPSGSFITQIKPTKKPPYVQDNTPKILNPEEKIYLAFVSNEGDTISHTYNMHWNAWQSPSRGKVPMNWAIAPVWVPMFPIIYEYLYETATPNDRFVCAPSGAGYAVVNRMDQELAEKFVKTTDRMMRDYLPLTELCTWGSDDRRVEESFVRNIKGLRGIYEHDGRAKYPQIWNLTTGDKTVAIQRYSCDYQGYWFNKFLTGDRKQVKEDIYQYLDEAYSGLPKPYYMLFYYLEDVVPERIMEIKNRLDPNKFEIIDMGTMAHLMKNSPNCQADIKAAQIPKNSVTWNSEMAKQPEKWSTYNDAKLEKTENGLRLIVPPGKSEAWIGIKNLVVPRNTTGIAFDLKKITGGKLSIRLHGWPIQNGQIGAWHLWHEPILQQEHITGSIEQVYIKQLRQNGYIPEMVWVLCFAPKETGGEVIIENFKFTKE
jgi:alpha-L-fucosidase